MNTSGATGEKGDRVFKGFDRARVVVANRIPPTDTADELRIEGESVRGDQRDWFEIRSAGGIPEEGEGASTASTSPNCRRPKPRPDLDGCEDPDRLFFVVDDCTNLIGQYAPLEGIITPASPEEPSPSRRPEPVENTLARGATVAPRANNKEKLDDDLKENHHQRSEKPTGNSDPVENHSRAAAPREKAGSGAVEHLALVRAAYEKATGNRWNKSDTEAYAQNGLQRIPAEKIISVLEAVTERTATKVNSLAYFVREILALQEPRNRAWLKKRLRNIVQRIRDNSVGRADYSTTDFLEDVKGACARESVPFDNDIFNDLMSSARTALDRTA